ncbi:MAG: hypothetical protein K2X35_14790 [Bryobacteraceae bacterium]|nr:hypothetical protein [Bryobacteraceae bacterium]
MDSKRLIDVLGRLIGSSVASFDQTLGTVEFIFRPSHGQKGEHRLQIECPWRFEHNDHVFAGSDDLDAALTVEERMRQMIRNSGSLKVESVEADQFAGFQLAFSSNCRLAVMPTSSTQMSWMLLFAGGGGATANDGHLSVKADATVQWEAIEPL